MMIGKKILHGAGLQAGPVIKLYRGFGGAEQLEIFGHVLERAPRPATYRGKIWSNILALLRLFMVKPRAGARVLLQWEQLSVEAVTDTDGFFHLRWQPATTPPAGWHKVQVCLPGTSVSAKGVVFIPHRSQYACVSDIDDTFLVSHSATVFKRLRELLTRNARTRQPFDGVVEHYRLLCRGNTFGGVPNPFFYVSSSEWNLYDYLVEFSRVHRMPRGVYLLSPLKPLHGLLKSGQNKHSAKFTRISRIFKSYPHLRFVLLGDDSQEDPAIYKAITAHFTSQVMAVYLRHVRGSRRAPVQQLVNEIARQGIPCCYFIHSREAIAHSRSIGLVV